MGPTLENVFEALADLLDVHAEQGEEDLGPGEGNFRCSECQGCTDCRFCVGCRSCERCTYCEGCEATVDCTQCRDSYDLQECSHSDNSRACVRCSYVTLCFDCEDCVQCFACVGLSGAEFHVLNEKRSRKEYFEIVGRLRAELERKAQDGFLPAFEDDTDGWFEALDQMVEPERASRPPERPAAAPAPTGPSITRGPRPQRPDDDPVESSPGRTTSRLRAGRRPSRS